MNIDNFIKKRKKEINNSFRNNCLVIGVDMDGVLCKGELWVDEINEPEPIQENIDKINKLSETNFIVIHTARRKKLSEITINWLDKYGVLYHAVRFDKMPADMYIDDKAFNFDIE